MSETLPGKGVFGWLGRQFGYVARAVRSNVNHTTVYRDSDVHEISLPDRPGVTLRRTVIDEVIVDQAASAPQNQRGQREP